MSNTQQHRPLVNANGSNGVPIAGSTTGVVVHTTDASTAANGGPRLDEISLWVNNPDETDQTCVVTVDGTALTFIVPADSTVQVLENYPLRAAAAGTGATITLTGAVDFTQPRAYGYFTRN